MGLWPLPHRGDVEDTWRGWPGKQALALPSRLQGRPVCSVSLEHRRDEDRPPLSHGHRRFHFLLQSADVELPRVMSISITEPVPSAMFLPEISLCFQDLGSIGYERPHHTPSRSKTFSGCPGPADFHSVAFDPDPGLSLQPETPAAPSEGSLPQTPPWTPPGLCSCCSFLLESCHPSSCGYWPLWPPHCTVGLCGHPVVLVHEALSSSQVTCGLLSHSPSVRTSPHGRHLAVAPCWPVVLSCLWASYVLTQQ